MILAWVLLEILALQSPYYVNMLVGGHDEDDGASLYFMDYLATMAKVSDN